MSAAEHWGLQRLAMLGSALEATELGVCLFDATNRLIFWNDRCKELSGYPETTFRDGVTLDELVLWSAEFGFYGSGDPRVLAAERLAALATPGGHDIYYFRASGEPVFMRGWRQPDGSLLYLMTAGFDYRAFIESANDAFLVRDYQGRVAEFNHGAEAIFGYRREEVFGRPLDSLFAPGETLLQLATLERKASIEGSSIEPVILTGRRRDGSEFSAEVSMLRLRTRSSPVLGAIVRDVSARIQAERALRESRAALERANAEQAAEHRRLERLARVGHWTWRAVPGSSDPSATGEYVMSEWVRSLLGIPAGAKITDRMLLGQVVHPEDRGRVGALWLDPAAGKPGAPIQRWRAVRPDGEVCHLETSYEYFFDESGALLSSFGTVRDVTETREMQDQLERLHREQLAEHQRTERLAKIGHWRSEIDPEDPDPLSAKLILSDAAKSILGMADTQELRSRDFLERVVHAEDRGWVERRWLQSSFDSRGEVVEFRALRPSGDMITVATIYEPLRDDSGRVIGDYGAMQDVTEARRTEAALRQAQRLEAVGRLTGGIAHDFNNLLGVITGNLELLLEGRDFDDRTRRLLQRAVDGARHGADLTKRLLAFSRRQTLQPKNVDLNETLERMAALIGRTLGEQIRIELQSARDLWLCRADPAQIDDAILNLSINARDAMPGGGRLILGASNAQLDQDYAVREEDVSPGDYVVLSVSDTGTGMPPEVLARVFEPFYTTKPEGKGTGLGLSMVWGFAKQSKGHIKIYSEIGRGTTVRIYLPRANAEDKFAAEDVPAAKNLPKGNETILVVEDNERMRQTSVEQIAALGYATIEAENAEGALAQLARHSKIALLYSDVVMSGPMTGYDLAREALRRSPNLKILLTTGYASGSPASPEISSNEFQVMEKPVTHAALAAKLRQLLDEGEP